VQKEASETFVLLHRAPDLGISPPLFFGRLDASMHYSLRVLCVFPAFARPATMAIAHSLTHACIKR